MKSYFGPLQGSSRLWKSCLRRADTTFSRCKSRGSTEGQSRHIAPGAANTTSCSNTRARQRYTSASSLKSDSGTLRRRRTGAGCDFPSWISAREAVALSCGLSTILQAARKCQVPSLAGRSRVTEWFWREISTCNTYCGTSSNDTIKEPRTYYG